MKNQKGTAAIEFAIVLPVLALLLFGIIESSTFLYDKAVITNASREGARAGIVFSDPPILDAEIQAVVNNYCKDHLITFNDDAPNLIDIVIERTGVGSPGDSLTVRVTYRYDFLVLPDLSNLFTDPDTGLPSGIDLTAETVMRME